MKEMTEQEINTEYLSDSSYATAHSSDSENEDTLCSPNTNIDDGQGKNSCIKCKNSKKEDLNVDFFKKLKRQDFLHDLEDALEKLVPKRVITITPIESTNNMSKKPSLEQITPIEPPNVTQSENKEKTTTEVKQVKNVTKKKEIGTHKPNPVIAKFESIFHKGSKPNTSQVKNAAYKPTILPKKKQASPSPNRKNITRKKQVDNKTEGIKDTTVNSLVAPGKKSKKSPSKKTPPTKKSNKKKIGENSGKTKLKYQSQSVDKAGNNAKEKKTILPKRVSFQPNMVEVVSYFEETSKDSLPQEPTSSVLPKEEPTPIVSENPQPKKVRIDPVSMTPERAATIKNFYKSMAKKTRNEHIRNKHERNFLAVKKLEFRHDFN